MLNREYTRKVELFLNLFQSRMFKAFGNVEFFGFFTYDRLSLEEASAMPRQPLPVGMPWGKKWEYGWFFGEITVPEELDGQRLELAAKMGESVVFVNGQVFGSFDQRHSHVTLTRCAKAGEVIRIAMEAYAGHFGDAAQAPNGRLGGPKNYTILVPEWNEQPFPEDVCQRRVQEASFGVLREPLFQLWIELSLLYDLRNSVDPDSLRRAMIDKTLMKLCDLINIEAPAEEFMAQVEQGRTLLKPLLECKNGSTTPQFYSVGHSHLDLEWLWTVNETRRKAARTLGNQLKLIEEYPEYKYIQSQPWILETVKNEYPELYQRIKKAVADGNIQVEGGMWVEADTNAPSGESLIRQFLFGKKFIKEEFGHESKVLWLPDIFGVSGSIPQIMKGCGVDYFMNAKVTWLYNEGDPLPHCTFNWQGIDGTKVLSHVIQGYCSTLTPGSVIGKWKENPEKNEIPVRMDAYGWGDGGGGATREHLECLRRVGDLEGMPKVKAAYPQEMYEYIEENCEVNKTFVGELYYAAHRGTYTSQAKTKKLNRQAEFALRDAEFWAGLLGKTDAKKTLDGAWKNVLFNQFHDIIPGSSLAEVYHRAEKSYQESIDTAKAVTDETLKQRTDGSADHITLFNSLGWTRTVDVVLPEGYTSVKGLDGETFPAEQAEGKVIARLEVPGCGQKSYVLGKEAAPAAKANDGLVLENELLRAEFDDKGRLISLVDKGKNTEFLSGPSNVFRLYQDMPTFCDAWDVDSFYENVEVQLEQAVAEPGIGSSLVISQKLPNSRISQKVTLKPGSSRLDFETTVDWQESHKLLKVDFLTNIHTEEMLSETQFGYVKRPTHRNRPYDADRFEVCQHKWSALCEGRRGVAILNDSKYGISARESRMSLTLLKAPARPDLYADKGIQVFTYSLMPFGTDFFDSGVVQQAYELNVPVTVLPGCGPEKTWLAVSESNVIPDTVKPAEDGSDDVIVRLYECQNSGTGCKLELGFDVKEAFLTDMLENNKSALPVQNGAVEFPMKGFEVVTLRLKR